MATLGQAINQLLQANGVPGNVVEVHGGPSALEVTFRQRDVQGRLGGTHTMTLDLHEQARPAGPVQHDGIDQLVRDVDFDGTPAVGELVCTCGRWRGEGLHPGSHGLDCPIRRLASASDD